MTRADLLALSRDDLVELANRGLVKRAAKDVDGGNGPRLECEADGTVLGRFDDGVVTRLPAGAGLEAAVCDCAATGRCRHQIAVILAYQRDNAAAAPEAATAPWSPGSVTDEELVRLFGETAVAGARRLFHAGYTARVHRASADNPQCSVELPSCAVRFLVPGEVGYVRSDAAESVRAEAVVQAVWAFRAADERDGAEADVDVTVGGRPTATTAATGLEPVLELLSRLLRDGTATTPPVAVAALRQAGRRLGLRNLHWPAAAIVELADQLDAHADRHTDHRPHRVAAVITELYARHRAATGGPAGRAHVLGGAEPAFTPLRQVRLTGLGCRVTETGGRRGVEVYLAMPESGQVLAVRHRWPAAEPPTTAAIADTAAAGTTLGNLAVSDLVTAAAERTAGRTLQLTADRLSRPTLTPVDDSWGRLPEAIRVTDLDRLRGRLATLPPGLIRPRVAAEFVRVVPIAAVEDLGYHPGDQRLRATVTHPGGARLTITAHHRAATPAALDRLAAALAGEHGRPEFLSGTTGRGASAREWEPIAIKTDRGVIVPDLAVGEGDTNLSPDAGVDADPITSALTEAITGCAELAHHGLDRPPRSLRDRLDQAAWELRKVGLARAADSLATLAKRLEAEDPAAIVTAWVDAQLRLLTTLELR